MKCISITHIEFQNHQGDGYHNNLYNDENPQNYFAVVHFYAWIHCHCIHGIIKNIIVMVIFWIDF